MRHDLNEWAEGNHRFECGLDESLRAAANQQPSRGLEARIKLALEKDERAEDTMQTYPASSVLWENGSVQSGWNLRGLFSATLAHGLLLLMIALLVEAKVGLVTPSRVETATLVVPPPLPLLVPRANTAGGGGGQKGPTPVTRGTPPRFAAEQLDPPKAPAMTQPRMEVPVTVDVQPDLLMAKSDLPQLGVANSPLVGMSLGNGRGTGLGGGTGGGIGPGTGGNAGGSLHRIGGGVSAPVVVYKPEPEFSEEARKAKVAGNVLVYLQVDEQGRPRNVRVVRGIGMGLDERAVAAVEQYRFRPATEDGRPVRVEMQVDVDFHIY